MNERQVSEPGSTITVSDISYALFRRKWTIVFFSILGVLGAAAFWVIKPPLYQSEAKLLIRYVTVARTPSPTGADPNVKQIDGGENLINTELQILTSFDLALQVAERIGAEKILAKAGGGTNREAAAGLIRKNLLVESPHWGSVIRVVVKHPDRDLVQPILQEIIACYFRTHLEIHQAGGLFGGFLSKETEQLQAQLSQTEQDLKQALAKVGVGSIDDAKRQSSEEISRLRQEIFDAQAELAERQAALEEWNKLSGSQKTQPEKTNVASRASGAMPTEAYRNVCARLNVLLTREGELLTQYTEEASPVKEVRQRIAQAEELKKKLEDENPSLANFRMVTQPGQATTSSFDAAAEAARVLALNSRIKVLNAQLDQIRAEASSLAQLEPTIQELQRKKEAEENQLRSVLNGLQQMRIDSLGADISKIQAPLPPYKDISKTRKILLMIVAAGFGMGLGWALLKELYLDNTVKRPKDVEVKLKLPLFLLIPDVNRKGRAKPDDVPLIVWGSHKENSQEHNGADVKPTKSDVARIKRQQLLQPFSEALRDRLVAAFEAANITRKPKLVGVTGLGRNTGVSTLATGLASCLSQAGDGNVLLVDLNEGHGAAQCFHMGKPGCGLATALEMEQREMALLRDNLYVVAEGPNGSPYLPPKQFTSLVTRLKASDYDYIIFDLPPVSQTSPTPRLARSLDVTLMVLEAEKTSQNAAKRARDLMRQSGANVAAVLNKYISRMPEALAED